MILIAEPFSHRLRRCVLGAPAAGRGVGAGQAQGRRDLLDPRRFRGATSAATASRSRPSSGPTATRTSTRPTPADARRLAEAKVVLVNGLKFEGWIDRLVKSSGTKARGRRGGDGRRAPRPKSRGRARPCPRRTSTRMPGRTSPTPRSMWRTSATPWSRPIRTAGPPTRPTPPPISHELDALEREVRAAIERIPRERRKIITSHDAFGYFEQAYGLDFIAPQGVSTEAEASAKDVARIIQQIKREKITAVFFENISDPRLIQRIAKETGAMIGGGSIPTPCRGPDGPAGHLHRHDATQYKGASARRCRS